MFCAWRELCADTCDVDERYPVETPVCDAWQTEFEFRQDFGTIPNGVEVAFHTLAVSSMRADICHPIPWHSDHSRRCNIEMGRLDAAMVARGLPELGRSSVRPMSFSHLLRLIVDGWTPSCRATLSARLPACSIPIARPHCTAVSRGMAKSILIFLNFRMSVTVCWHDLYIMKENSDMDTAKTISQYMYMQYDLTIFFFFLGGQYIFRSTCVRRPLFLLMWVEEKILLPHRESNPGRRRERPES